MTDAVVFIGAAIIAVTQVIKHLAPRVNGAVTVAVAAGLGLLVALIDTEIGVNDIAIAEGIMIGLAASGAHNVARQIGVTDDSADRVRNGR